MLCLWLLYVLSGPGWKRGRGGRRPSKVTPPPPHQVMCAETCRCHSGHSKGPAPSREPEAGWSEEEMEVLVKAVNLFPPGTTDR